MRTVQPARDGGYHRARRERSRGDEKLIAPSGNDIASAGHRSGLAIVGERCLEAILVPAAGPEQL